MKKRFLATALCASMALSSTVAFAAGTDVTELPKADQDFIKGDGQLEGYVTLDVTKVTVPTSATMDFTLDPQGLLNKASSTDYKITSGAVYFANTGSKYSDTSDPLEIVNKSSFPVNVAVKVDLEAKGTPDNSALSSIKLAESKTALATETDPALYFGVIKNADDAVAITSSGQTVDASLDAVPMVEASRNYKAGDVVYIADAANNSDAITTGTLGTDFKATSDTGYTQKHIVTAEDTAVIAATKAAVTTGYELNAVAEASASQDIKDKLTVSPNGYYYYYDLTSGYTSQAGEKVSFKLTGATNNVEGWGDVTETVAANVTYTLTKAEEAKDVISATLIAGQPMVVKIPTTKMIVNEVRIDGATGPIPTARYTCNADGTNMVITFDSTFTTNNKDGIINAGNNVKFTVTFGDTTTTEFFVTAQS